MTESARFCIIFGKFDQGYAVICEMNRINSLNPNFIQYFDENRKKKLQNWSLYLSEDLHKEETASYKALFKGRLKGVTPLLWVNWYVSSFNYYGIIYLLPSVLS